MTSQHPEEKQPFDFMKVRNNNGQPMKDFITYDDAKRWVTRLGFESYPQWRKFAVMRYKKGPLRGKLIRPTFIPSHPKTAYPLRGYKFTDPDFLGHHQYWKYLKAKEWALSLDLSSSYAWRQWHKENNPIDVPRYPELVYKDWTIWADFLGSEYIHHTKRVPFATYDEALKVVHALGLESPEEYKEWIKSHPQYNLPICPDGHYEEWDGWNRFLGKKLIDRIEVHQEIHIPVLYIAHHNHHPDNVYEIRVESKGNLEVEARKTRHGFKIIKKYTVQPNDMQTMKTLIDNNCSSWWQDNHAYIVRNVHELLFQLDVLLFSIR